MEEELSARYVAIAIAIQGNTSMRAAAVMSLSLSKLKLDTLVDPRTLRGTSSTIILIFLLSELSIQLDSEECRQRILEMVVAPVPRFIYCTIGIT